MAKNANRTIGITPETKKPQWFSNQIAQDHGIKFSMEETAVEVLNKHGNWLRYKNKIFIDVSQRYLEYFFKLKL